MRPIMLSKSGSNGFNGSIGRLMGFTLILLASSAASAAGSAATYSVRVPVVSSTPLLTSRTESIPERTCRPVQPRTYSSSYSSSYGGGYDNRYGHGYSGYDRDYRYRGGDNIGGQILGGLIGGAIGNQFGRGNGRKAFTIAGALVGSSLARDNRRYSRNDRNRRGYQRDYEPEYVCQTSTRERVIETVTGYEVTYEYNGALHVRTMAYDPGEFIELQVTAEPLPPTDTQAGPEISSSTFSSISASSSPTSFRSSRRTL